MIGPLLRAFAAGIALGWALATAAYVMTQPRATQVPPPGRHPKMAAW